MKPTVEEIAAALRSAAGGTNYPPVEVNDHLKKVIQTYIDMGLDAQTIINVLNHGQKTWWRIVGSKLFKKGKK